MKYLLSQGANVHANKDYAIRWSASTGNLILVKLLVKHGADIHAEDEYALQRCAIRGYFDVMKFLVEQGAKVSFIQDFRNIPLF